MSDRTPLDCYMEAMSERDEARAAHESLKTRIADLERQIGEKDAIAQGFRETLILRDSQIQQMRNRIEAITNLPYMAFVGQDAKTIAKDAISTNSAPVGSNMVTSVDERPGISGPDVVLITLRSGVLIEAGDDGVTVYAEAGPDGQGEIVLCSCVIGQGNREMEGWTLSADGKWLHRTGDGSWLRTKGDSFYSPQAGKWVPVLDINWNTPSASGFPYRRPVKEIE